MRSGDLAPGQARFAGTFACRLASVPDGGMLFADAAGTTLFLDEAGAIRALARAGEEAPGGGRYASFCDTAAGNDGTIAFQASLADGREGVYRIDPGAAGAEQVVVTGETLPLAAGDATMAMLAGPAVTGAGTVAASVDFAEGVAAVIEVPRGGAPQILIQTGDPLGTGFFQRSPTSPAANSAGTIAFTATLDSGVGLVATVEAGALPRVQFIGLPSADRMLPTVDLAPPAINDPGQVAFLWTDHGAARLQTVDSGLSRTIAAPGLAAPGGGVFIEITDLAPVIDATGGVFFGAIRSTGGAGIYVARSQMARVAEQGLPIDGGGSLTTVGNRQPQPRPAIGPDGSLWFAGEAASPQGAPWRGLFSSAASGGAVVIRSQVRSGDPIQEPASFASFLETSIPYLGGGPSLGAGGSMIFDARLTGGTRGLFLRGRGGALSAVALDGDDAPGGGRLEGESFAYHSVSGTTVAFLGSAAGDPSSGAVGAGKAIYYGRPGTGTLRRLLAVGDPEPGGTRAVADLQPPSRLNRAAALVIPAVLSDGSGVLYGFDGTGLVRVLGSGDPAPGSARFVRIFTGSVFLSAPIPPTLDDAGTVLFGATTSDGDSALYAAPMLAPGAGTIPQRVVGLGDEVEGGRLFPLEIAALDRDGDGRVALEAIFDDNFDFGTFLKEGEAPAAAVARPFDLLPDLGFVYAVAPRLALAGGGSLAYDVRLFDNTEAILLRAAGGATAEIPTADAVIAATGRTAPDGGVYLALRPGSRPTNRLASDGAGALAFVAATDSGPEEIVLFGAPANAPPVADAGPDQVVECAGPSGTAVTLDGRASSDPDGDPLTYLWSGPFGVAEGAQPTVTLPLGASTVTLVVSDGQETSAPDSVTISVRDTLPPAISVGAAPAVLWPPDGRMIDVSFPITVSDRCDARPVVALVEVTTRDAAGGRPGPSIGGADLGSDDRSIALRADRSGAGSGRIYAVTYRATDRSGNGSAATALVAVPHDQRR